MRKIALFIILIGVCLHAHSNPTERELVYLNDRMEIVKTKTKATYICKMEGESDEGFLFKAYYISGELKMEGYYLDEHMKKAHGTFTYYYLNGEVESTGEFRNGVKYGIWQRYHEDGEAKAEKIYAVEPMLQAMKDLKK